MNNHAKPSLLELQWAAYPHAHRNRKNLILHLVAVPLFMVGTVMVATSPLTSGNAAIGGLVAMTLAMAVQGFGHRQEVSPPPPFRNKLDAVLRIFAEQWITFPRFVLNGSLSKTLPAPSSPALPCRHATKAKRGIRVAPQFRDS